MGHQPPLLAAGLVLPQVKHHPGSGESETILPCLPPLWLAVQLSRAMPHGGGTGGVVASSSPSGGGDLQASSPSLGQAGRGMLCTPEHCILPRSCSIWPLWSCFSHFSRVQLSVELDEGLSSALAAAGSFWS